MQDKTSGGADGWWAEGLLFENCNCTAVCPGHIHFSQKCTHDVCHGFWAIRFRKGRLGAANLAGLDAVIVFETPPVMIEGGWKQRLLVTDRADPAQVEAVDGIVAGRHGGPWEVLSRFVSTRLPTRTVPVRIKEGARAKSVTATGILSGAVEAIRGRDKGRPVSFRNIYNQIHDARQVVAMGSTQCDDGEIAIETRGTHGLWSNFRWAGSGGRVPDDPRS